MRCGRRCLILISCFFNYIFFWGGLGDQKNSKDQNKQDRFHTVPTGPSTSAKTAKHVPKSVAFLESNAMCIEIVQQCSFGHSPQTTIQKFDLLPHAAETGTGSNSFGAQVHAKEDRLALNCTLFLQRAIELCQSRN